MYRAFEHANDQHGDSNRWYVAFVGEDGSHPQPQHGGTMDESSARKLAARLNQKRPYDV